MQKKLIALAIAGLVSAPAMAQVTVYGIADVYVGNTSRSGTTKTMAMGSGGLSTSRLGFKGEEDLGNGLKALFQLEGKVSVDEGTFASGFDRQSNVGVAGSFGTVKLGRQSGASDEWQSNYDAAGNQSSRLRLNGDVFLGEKQANSVGYTSPNMGGVTAMALYQFGEENTEVANSNDDTAYEVGAQYAVGPLAATLILGSKDSASTIAGTELEEMFAAASYDFGVAKVALSQTESDAKSVATGATVTTKVTQVAAIAPVSKAGGVHFTHGTKKVEGSADTTALTLAYAHDLSKRTTAYAAYDTTKVDNGTPTTKFYGVGLRHKF